MKSRFLALMTLIFIGVGVTLVSCSGKNPASPTSYTPTPTVTSTVVVVASPVPHVNGGVVSTFAGIYGGSTGLVNGTAVSVTGYTAAEFDYPYGVAVDKNENVYVADYDNDAVRKISNGTVSTLATGFDDPWAIAVDNSGNVYVGDTYHYQIKEITVNNNATLNIAGNGTYGNLGGAANSAEIGYAYGIAVDNSGNVFYCDESYDVVKEISNGVVFTIAGTGASGFVDGAGAQAQFDEPYGIAVDNADNVYVADYGNYAIRKITSNGIVSTIAQLPTEPYCIAYDPTGNLYVGTEYDVYQIGLDGTSRVLAGTGSSGHVNGTGTAASFYYIYGLAVDGNGNVFVGDEDNNLIREIK